MTSQFSEKSASDKSNIFEEHYRNYCAQIAGIDFSLIKDTLGIENDGDRMIIPFYGNKYIVSGHGITDAAGKRPDYMTCVILAKYILLCPDKLHYDTEWVAFKDFKKVSHFTNVNFFSSDIERAIEKHFSGRLDQLIRACKSFRGIEERVTMSYDLSILFDALPRISLLLLFNDLDGEFPAQCKVLFQKHSEFYLDPESLAMTGVILANSLKRYT